MGQTPQYQAELRDLEQMRTDALRYKSQYGTASAYVEQYRLWFSMLIRKYERQQQLVTEVRQRYAGLDLDDFIMRSEECSSLVTWCQQQINDLA
jgi:hypothetical protein